MLTLTNKFIFFLIIKTCIPEKISSNNLTLSAPDALFDAVLPEREVILVSSASAVVKHLAPLGLGVVREPLLCTVTCPRVHGTEAHPFRL